MPSLVRGSGIDLVQAPHGTGPFCTIPEIYTTDECSSTVFIGGFGVVREGDAMQVHPQPGCDPHIAVCDTYSSTVYVEGKRVARVGDTYGPDSPHVILTGLDTIQVG